MTPELPILKEGPREEPEPDRTAAHRKLGVLRRELAGLVEDGVLVAFSGGTDSAFLLWVASELQARKGGRVVALTTVSASTPAWDREDAERFTRGLGVEHLWVESEEMDLPAYTRNDRNRCYHCKTELFRIATEVADRQGLRWLLYGYNASDHGDDRPGHRAAQEGGVLSPLSDAGLGKGDIRLLMADAGLPLAEKAASPCLSSRVMTGMEITTERLRDIADLEDILRAAGVRVFRVRVCSDGTDGLFLRVEVDPEEMGQVLTCREQLQALGLARGYRWVTLDLGGYRTGGGTA
jgi:uncharacterized protein